MPPHDNLVHALGTRYVPHDSFVEDVRVPHRFNRLLVYRANFLHSATAYFGEHPRRKAHGRGVLLDGEGMNAPTADPAIKYQFEVDLDAAATTRTASCTRSSREAGRQDLEILEVGCSSGYVGATLAAKGHRVTGIEPDPSAAEAARSTLAGSAQRYWPTASSTHTRIAVSTSVLFGDVLEHIADPAATLRRCVAAISPPMASSRSRSRMLPMAAIRAMLLDGRLDYADYGLFGSHPPAVLLPRWHGGLSGRLAGP